MSNNPEYIEVELPFIEQLKRMGWQHIQGDTGVPYLTERDSFRQVLLMDRMKEAIRRINLDDDGHAWLDDSHIIQAIGDLERLGTHKLMEANQLATDLLLRGTIIEGEANENGGKGRTVRFIDFKHPERNDFLAINQFRVDAPGTGNYIIPDIVLFVNGIPLVVVECKSRYSTSPMEEGITQILRYSNQRDWVDMEEGVERLFHYNQFTISTFFDEARFGTISSSYEHFLEWKDTSPEPSAQVAYDLGVDKLRSQHTLIAGMLRKEHLLDIVRNFTLFQNNEGTTIKIVGRYQQFRAVHKAINKLLTGKTRKEHGENDQRGGIVWHTQGSGKSLTMVFLVRKMRTLPELRRFKVVVVTDRVNLEKQLRDTAALTGETVRPDKGDKKRHESPSDRIQRILGEDGPDLVFAMIQKYQEHSEDEEAVEDQEIKHFPLLNDSESILLLVDEAHRSHAHFMHANLMRALPNCAKIGFTGTPIIMGERKKTHEIFGEFIDRYTIRQSEADGATVPIVYEGRTADAEVADGLSLDGLFEDMFRERTPEELESIKAKYATKGSVLEAENLIAAKAEDMLRHYIDNVLPNGLKAQIASTSRRAAVRYQKALEIAHKSLVNELVRLDPAMIKKDEEGLAKLDAKLQFLIRAYPHLNVIRRLEFAVVISGGHNDDPAFNEWSDPSKTGIRIVRFKKPLVHDKPDKQDGLAFLCVKSMLLTGFDAPVEQVLYLDRFMQGHELLQAIARVNRTRSKKKCGYVVDYCGIGRHLKEALAVYSDDDIQGALNSIRDELPKLAERHRRVIAVFRDHGIKNISDREDCIDLLRDLRIRADFEVKLKQFLETLEIVMPRPEALPYLRDAKRLGYINKAAANLYRDPQLNIVTAGEKVRQLIDQYIIARGIDPKVLPISIMDADFEKAVDGHISNRAKASEMEHAARYHISKHFSEDPAYYKALSERLEEIIQNFKDNWTDLVEALREFTHKVREGRPADETGLDPKTQSPFLGILIEEVGTESNKSQKEKLAGLTVEMVDHIGQEIRVVDFWRNVHAQNVLRAWIIELLDDNNVIPFHKQKYTADRVMELAKALHTRLSV